jgi:hypothetical protein
MLNHLGALLVATEPSYTAGLSPQTSHALVLLLLDLHQQGYLVYQSGFFPKALGIILVVGCGSYLVDVAGTYLSAGFTWSLSTYPATLAGLAELLFLLWLLIVGAKVPRRDEYVQATADASVRV